jgi:hypothetical protein
MAKINRLIPFGWLPANWGLTGSRREKALAEYYYDGEDLAYKLLDIDFPEDQRHENPYRAAKLRLDYRYHKVGEFDYGLGLIETDDRIVENDRQRQLAKYLHKFGRLSAEELEYKLLDLSYEVKNTELYLKEKLALDVQFGHKTQEQADHELLDLKHEDKTTVDYKIAQQALELQWGNITQNQHDKEVATLLEEPWFNFMGADQKIRGENVQMAVELDWNDFFVKFLEGEGWTGSTPDEIVDRWFESAMKQMMNIYEAENLEDDGSGDPLPMAGTNRIKRDDGLTEYR